MESKHIRQMKHDSIQEIYNKFNPNLPYTKFKLDAYYICACIGLTFHKEVEKFFEDSRWQEPGHQAELLEEIKVFLEKYVK